MDSAFATVFDTFSVAKELFETSLNFNFQRTHYEDVVKALGGWGTAIEEKNIDEIEKELKEAVRVSKEVRLLICDLWQKIENFNPFFTNLKIKFLKKALFFFLKKIIKISFRKANRLWSTSSLARLTSEMVRFRSNF